MSQPLMRCTGSEIWGSLHPMGGLKMGVCFAKVLMKLQNSFHRNRYFQCRNSVNRNHIEQKYGWKYCNWSHFFSNLFLTCTINNKYYRLITNIFAEQTSPEKNVLECWPILISRQLFLCYGQQPINIWSFGTCDSLAMQALPPI